MQRLHRIAMPRYVPSPDWHTSQPAGIRSPQALRTRCSNFSSESADEPSAAFAVLALLIRSAGSAAAAAAFAALLPRLQHAVGACSRLKLSHCGCAWLWIALLRCTSARLHARSRVGRACCGGGAGRCCAAGGWQNLPPVCICNRIQALDAASRRSEIVLAADPCTTGGCLALPAGVDNWELAGSSRCGSRRDQALPRLCWCCRSDPGGLHLRFAVLHIQWMQREVTCKMLVIAHLHHTSFTSQVRARFSSCG